MEREGEFRPSDFDDRKVSGEKTTPMARKATATTNLVIHAIVALLRVDPRALLRW